MLSTKSDDRVESSRGKRERERRKGKREREISIIPRKRRVSTRGVREKERQMGWERRKERKGGGAVFWYSRRDSLEGIRVLFFAEKRNFAYLAGCRQGLDVNRLISVHESSRGGREARARNYLFASGFTRAPKEARSRSRAREPRELISNNEAALFAPCPLLLSRFLFLPLPIESGIVVLGKEIRETTRPLRVESVKIAIRNVNVQRGKIKKCRMKRKIDKKM